MTKGQDENRKLEIWGIKKTTGVTGQGAVKSIRTGESVPFSFLQSPIATSENKSRDETRCS